MPELAEATEASYHPAIRVWERFSGEVVTAVETLKAGSKSSVYRLIGRQNSAAVIAKRCELECARIERIVYEQVLPKLDNRWLSYYGSLVDGPSWWLFLEDTGGLECTLESHEERVLAARWLAQLHLSAAAISKPGDLPLRDASWYLGELEAVGSTIHDNLKQPALSKDDVYVLESVLRACESLAQSWSVLREICGVAPVTLTHGDFHPKNIHFRRTSAGLQLFALDWEYAGWGPPAVDLPEVDAEQYGLAVKCAWPKLGVPAIRRLSQIGRIFQWVSALNWAATYLPTGYVARCMREIRCYESEAWQIIAETGGCWA